VHCIQTSCTAPADQHNAYEFAKEVCAQVGVTLPSFEEIQQGSSGVRRVDFAGGILAAVVAVWAWLVLF
jgi:hypothetical protein